MVSGALTDIELQPRSKGSDELLTTLFFFLQDQTNEDTQMVLAGILVGNGLPRSGSGSRRGEARQGGGIRASTLSTCREVPTQGIVSFPFH